MSGLIRDSDYISVTVTQVIHDICTYRGYNCELVTGPIQRVDRERVFNYKFMISRVSLGLDDGHILYSTIKDRLSTLINRYRDVYGDCQDNLLYSFIKIYIPETDTYELTVRFAMPELEIQEMDSPLDEVLSPGAPIDSDGRIVREQPTTCKYCRSRDVKWVQFQSGRWEMQERVGRKHSCEEYRIHIRDHRGREVVGRVRIDPLSLTNNSTDQVYLPEDSQGRANIIHDVIEERLNRQRDNAFITFSTEMAQQQIAAVQHQMAVTHQELLDAIGVAPHVSGFSVLQEGQASAKQVKVKEVTVIVKGKRKFNLGE